MADSTRWLVIGGGSKAGVYRTCPVFPCGRSTPPLPIAIECESETEARSLYRIFQPTLSKLSPKSGPSDILTAFQHSDGIRNFFPNGTRDFYAVVIGAPAGIHRTRTGAENSKGSFAYHSYRHTQSFWEALAFMVVKGQEARMPPLLTSTELAEESHVSLEEAFDRNLHLGSSSPTLGTTTPTDSLRSSLSHDRRHDDPVSPPRYAPEADHTNPRASSSATPIVYIHVRNLSGVVSSQHHVTRPSLEATAQARRLGEDGARYVLAHGYQPSDIATIVQIYRRNDSKESFALQLAALGMALAEATYLGDLIYLDSKEYQSIIVLLNTLDMPITEVLQSPSLELRGFYVPASVLLT
ncbi:hypothetical protein EDD15DRAFT_2373779 [Pisolithus albus]|nr:hypothetical protein EDD15DRAFT_2373779 [Pisolithus albus]